MKRVIVILTAAIFFFCLATPARAETSIDSDWTLTADVTIDDDVRITKGTVNLNGYSLTIKGRLLQTGGEMNINGGCLAVTGDYLIQSESGGNSSGTLKMTNPDDKVSVGGRFVMQSGSSHRELLTKGKMELKGDFSQAGYSYNFSASDTHEVILSGDGTQTVSFAQPAHSHFNILKINKPVPGKLVFATDLPVAGTLLAYGYELVDVSFARDMILAEDTYIDATEFFLVSKSIDLNGKKLSVRGNLRQTGGEMNINGGCLAVTGDYLIQSESGGSSSGTLKMTNPDDEVSVGGRFVMQSSSKHSTLLTNGTMELKGDFSQAGYSYNFSASDTHEVILSGDGTQTVSFAQPAHSHFNILKINKPVPGKLVFATDLPVAGTLFAYGYELLDVSFARNMILAEDTYISATEFFRVSKGIDLNGKKLSVRGNLRQTGGEMNINGGCLEVTGDYLIQDESGGYSNGTLKMTNPDDKVSVGGRFVMQSGSNHSELLTNGTMELKGDFSQVAGNSYNFCASGTHKVILSGDGTQSVSFANPAYSCFNILKINKPVPGKLIFATDLPVAGTLFAYGYELLDVSFARNMILAEDTYIGASEFFRVSKGIDVNGKKLSVRGNLRQTGGEMNINGGCLEVTGDYLIQDESGGYSNGTLKMTNPDDKVSVGGRFVMQSGSNHSELLTNGTMELKGDFSQVAGNSYNFRASGTHKVILSGDGTQSVSFANPAYSCFNDLEIKNYAASGVNFDGSLNVARNLTSNGIPLPGLTVQNRQWTLAEDGLIQGDLRLLGATLNIAGRILIVTGNLIHAGGTLKVNGGRLIVKGDYLMQAENGGTSSGYLDMLNDADYVKVCGDFITKAYYSQSNHLIAGTLEVLGDFTQLSGGSSYAFKATADHRVLLSGTDVQTVSFANHTTSRFATLVITKDLETGYIFTCPTPVWDTLVQQAPFIFVGIEDGQRFIQPVPVDLEYENENVTLQRILLIKDGGTPVEIQEGYVVETDGRYLLQAEGLDEGGNTLNAQVSFAVDLTPPVAVIAGGPFEVFNDGTMLVFDGSGSSDQNGIRLYRWTFSDGSILEGAAVERAFAVPGDYTVTLLVEDGFGNPASAEADIRVRSMGGTEIVITGVKDGGKYNHDVNVTISVTDGTLAGVYLDEADIGPVSAFTVDGEGAHTLYVEATNSEGYTTRMPLTGSIGFLLDKTPPVAKPGDDITVYKGDVVTFDGTGSTDLNGIAAYVWQIPGEEPGEEIERTEATFTHVFSKVGVYPVTLRVMDICGNWSDDDSPAARIVTVRYREPKVKVSGVAKGGCYNHDVTIHVTVEYGAISSTTLNGEPIDNGSVVSAEGKYALKIVPLDEGGQPGPSAIYEFTIDKTKPVAVIKQEDLTVYEGEPVLLDGTLSSDDSGYLTYAWTINGEPHGGGAVIRKVFEHAGEYDVSLVVTDPAGNESDPPAEAQVKVNPRGNVEIAITGVDDGGKYNRNVQAEIAVTGGVSVKILVDNKSGPANPFFNTDGIHEIYVEAVSETGYIATRRVRFSIDKTPPVADAGGELTAIAGQAITLIGKGTDQNPIVDYKWVLYDEEEQQELSGNKVSVVFAEAGVYTAELTVMDDHGNWSEESTARITVRCRAPEVKILGIANGEKTKEDVAVDLEIAYGTLKEIRLNGLPYTPGTPITNEGYYYLDIVVLDQEGAEHQFKTHFAIDRTKPTAEAGPDVTGWNDGELLVFSAYRSEDNYGIKGFVWTFSYLDDPEEPEQVYDTMVVRRSFNKPGTYAATLVVTDMAGNVSEPDTAYITIRDAGNTVITFTGFSKGQQSTADILAGVTVTGGTLTKFTIDGEEVLGDSILVTADGKHVVTAEATSDEGYVRKASSYFYIDKSLPVPDTGGDKTGYNGQQFIFDGGFSYDPVGIAEYRWIFSDSEIPYNEERVIRTFDTPGEYLAQLWVKDTFGNWCAEPATSRIVIKDRELLATLDVAVHDGAGHSLPGAVIVLEDGNGNQARYIADSTGHALLAAEAGEYKLYAWRSGYKSTVVPVTLQTCEAKQMNVSLTPGMDIQIVSEARRLDLEEIKALGIDTNDPANRWVCMFEARIVYEGLDMVIPIYSVGGGKWFAGQPKDSEGTDVSFLLGCGGEDGGDGEHEWQQAVIVIRGTASVLKEFYDLTVYILNFADPGVTLDNLQMRLNLPEGLALAPIAAACETSSGEIIRRQVLEVPVPSVPGQATQKVIWTLRGDRPGSYYPSVDYEGVFNPFAHEIKGTTQPADPIVITDPRVLQVQIEAPGWVVAGEKTDIKVSLVNTGDKPFYDAYLTVDEIILDNLRPAYDLSALHVRQDVLEPGEAISLTFQVIPTISGPCVGRNIRQIGGNASFTLQALPPAPMSVYAESGDGVVSLYWFSTYEYDAMCHRVKRREEGQTEYVVVGPYVYGSFFDDTTVENYKRYYYVVVAVSDLGDGFEGTPSKEVEAYPGTLTADPAPGIYNDPISVDFDVPSGCTVYYTTDGSAPSQGLATPYTGSLRVNRTMTIRAVVVNGASISRVYNFFYQIENPFFGDFVDCDWTWQAPAGPSGPSYINQGNTLTIDIPADQIYDPAAGNHAMFLREISAPNWSAETRLTLEEYTPGGDFDAGMIVLAGDVQYTWGFLRGTDLAAGDGQGPPPIQVPSGATTVHLRIRREGPLYCFEYKLNEADPWIYAGSIRSTLAAERIGLYAGTWGIPTELGLSAQGFAVKTLPSLDPNWRFESVSTGPCYSALGLNSFTLTVPQDQVYMGDTAPRMIRYDMGDGDWTVKAQAILGSYSGTDFRAGLTVEFGSSDDRFFFGLEGPNLTVRKLGRDAATWSAAGIGPNVYLRVSKAGAHYCFDYRTLEEDWTTLAEIDCYLPIESVGAMAETWVTPTQLRVEIRNFALTRDQADQAWDWQWESSAGPIYWFIAKDGMVIEVPEEGPYDDATATAPKMARADLGVEDWTVSARVDLDVYRPGDDFLSGLFLECTDGQVYYWGLWGGTGLALRGDGQVLEEVPGIGDGVYLGLLKRGDQVRLAYRLDHGSEWRLIGHVLTPASGVQRAGLVCSTWEKTPVRTIFTEITFDRHLGEAWTWYIPEPGPTYQVNIDGSVTLTVPDDRAYNHTTSLDDAPQCRRSDFGEKDWILETRVCMSENTSTSCETGLMVSFSRYDMVFFGLAGNGELRVNRSAGYGTSVEYAEQTVCLQIRKQGALYTFSYRAMPQSQWTVVGVMEISQAPQNIGFMTRTSESCLVRTTFGEFRLLRMQPEYELTLRISNAEANCRVSGAILTVDGLPPIDVDAAAPFDVAANVLTLSLVEGTHALRLTAPGYEDYETTVDLYGDTELRVEMAPLQPGEDGLMIYGRNIEFDAVEQRVTVFFLLLNNAADARLWVKISLRDGNGNVLALLGQQLYLAGGGLAVLGGQGELAFIGISGAASVLIEIYPFGDEGGTPLLAEEHQLGSS